MFTLSVIKATDVLFSTFGQGAQLIFKDKTSVEVKVIHRFPDKIVDVMESPIHTETHLFDVRLIDFDTKKVLSKIVIHGKTYTVQGEPVRDQHGLVLRIEAYASESSH